MSRIAAASRLLGDRELGLGARAAALRFHLRTWELDGNIETAKITSNLRNPVADPLGRALQSAGR